MYEDSTVGVVVPAHNEEGLVGTVIDTLPSFVDRAYVVDDRSTDGTWAEIQRHVERLNAPRRERALADGGAGRQPLIVPIRHETNRGRGGAVKTGYRAALDDGLDVVAVLDGDGQMDPAILDRFVAPVASGAVDYAKGNRLVRRDFRRGMSRWRFVGNGLLTYLTKVASGYWRMTDSQNGYTAISARTLRRLDVDRLYEGYGFLNDILVKLNAIEARVADVTMPARYGDERSGIRYTTFIPRVSGLLLRDFLWRLKVRYLVQDFHPLVQLYALAGASVVASVVMLGWLVVGTRPTAVEVAMAFLLFVVGAISASLAMAFDREHNVGLERQLAEPPSAARVSTGAVERSDGEVLAATDRST